MAIPDVKKTFELISTPDGLDLLFQDNTLKFIEGNPKVKQDMDVIFASSINEDFAFPRFGFDDTTALSEESIPVIEREIADALEQYRYFDSLVSVSAQRVDIDNNRAEIIVTVQAIGRDEQEIALQLTL